MATATDFIGMVYDTIAKTLNINNDTSNMVMQMAWPGFSLSPADFKAASAPNGPYDPNIAIDQFSSIVDIAPALSKLRFENSGYEISDLYEILLSSAIPVGATQNDIATNPMYKLFSDALYNLETMKRGKVEDPNVFYHPSTASPSNWYDEAAAASWPTIEINSTNQQPSQPSSSVFVRNNGAALMSASIFRMKPKLDIPIKIKPVIPKDVKVLNTLSNIRPSALSGIKPAQTSSVAINPAILHNTNTAFINKTTPVAFNNARAATTFKQNYIPVNKLADTTSNARIANITFNKNLSIQSAAKLSLAENIVIKNLIFNQLDTKPAQGNTTGFQVKFKYCSVNITRPWLNMSLLSTKNWYMQGVSPSDYSTGSLDNNPGMFPLLPVSFIVIKDLSISANWSQQDKSSLNDAVSFGPFDIRNGSWNQDTLTIGGMQIICWVCKATPALPPAAQP